MDADLKKRIKRREYKKRQKLKAQQKKGRFFLNRRASFEGPVIYNIGNLPVKDGL